MKKLPFITLIFFASLSVLLLFEHCGEDEPTPEPNKAPTCSITSPSNNATAALGTTVTITVSASDADGSVSNVKISIDDVNVSTLNASPYTYDWNTDGVDPGQHTIKAVATDDGGLSANSQITVTVTADAPFVTTTDITAITGTTATSGGNVTDDGGVDVTARGVVWGESSGPTLASNTGFTEDGTGTGAFTSSLTGLTIATTYYVKAYATNSQGTAYGEEKSFMTAGLPTVVNGNVSDITNESAICSGEVTDDGGTTVTARGLVWKTNVGSPPTIEDNEDFTTEGSGLGSFTSSMTSLASFTNYQVRAYATNSAGTAYGDTKYFWTLVGPPAVTTIDITNIDAHVAIGGGEVTDFGGSTSLDGVGIVWGTSPNPDISDVNSYDGFSQIYPFSPTSDNPFEILLTGLVPDTEYYVRAFAGNAHSTAYGQEITFTTGSFSTQTGSFEDARDNTQYSTVTISGQTWMAENLAYLPEVCAPDADCGYWVYDYSGTDVNAAKAESNYTTYGVLYNWEMASTSCPAGWHLPSRSEWSIFEMNLGLEYNWAIGHVRPNDSDQGGKIKETSTTHWNSPNAGATNISGFTALPGGRLYDLNNTFENIQSHGYFWASDEPITGQAFFRHVRWDYTKILAENRPPEGGYSVRCVQD